MKSKTKAASRSVVKKEVKKSVKVKLKLLPTGVPGLDEILGGGISEFSFNIIGGPPGCGKTTMAHQFAFANGTPKKPSLFFTICGEPLWKMLRFQQQFSFFDESKLGESIRFVNLSDVVQGNNLDMVLQEIIKQVKLANAGVVVVDSFRTLARRAYSDVREADVHSFIHRLTEFLTSWESTTFLVGEYFQEEIRDDPLFNMVDGILWLSQLTDRNSIVRKLQVIKLRGQLTIPGLHSVRISDVGLQAFSRTLSLPGNKRKAGRHRRLSIGIPELDKMLGGGLREGDSLMIAGPSGTGKSALATHFIAEGIRCGEPGVIAVFEERPEDYLQRAGFFGLDLKTAMQKGTLEAIYLCPLDLSVDETLHNILEAIIRIGAKRLVIDSIVGFEMAFAPGFRVEFREALYRMIGVLTSAGITVVSTVEMDNSFNAFHFSHYAVSIIIRTRYVEICGQLRKILVVIKMRGSNHSKDIREYVITDKGMVVIHPRRTDLVGLTTGIPTRSGPPLAQENEDPPEPKATK